jgi:hypothetical protein
VQPRDSHGNHHCEAVSIWPSRGRYDAQGRRLAGKFFSWICFHGVQSDIGHTPRQHRVRRHLGGEECQGQGQVQGQGQGEGQQDHPAFTRPRPNYHILSFLSGRRVSEGDESKKGCAERGYLVAASCLFFAGADLGRAGKNPAYSLQAAAATTGIHPVQLHD